LNPWDHAAGALIATEAGAAVIGRDGVPGGKDLLVAAAPELASELASLVESLRIRQ
jgi:myo-inositol-1(or 4)-monophosphatase